jgi:hypothetical protein
MNPSESKEIHDLFSENKLPPYDPELSQPVYLGMVDWKSFLVVSFATLVLAFILLGS